MDIDTLLDDTTKINGKTFLEYLYDKEMNPFDIALADMDKLKSMRRKWEGKSPNFDTMEKTDLVYLKLSQLKCSKIDNDKLVDVIKKMVNKDTTQLRYVGSWVYYSLINDKTKALKNKSKVSDKYIKTLTTYIDDFIKQLKRNNVCQK